MDMLRAARLHRITEAEDKARQLRNSLAGYTSAHMTKAEGHALADALTQGLQAIREML